jgi:hypothetical protein
MHSSLGYLSPAQFERECQAKLIEAANDDLSIDQNENSLETRNSGPLHTSRLGYKLASNYLRTIVWLNLIF